MKSQKGVTLASLTIYITLIFITLAVLAVITTNMRSGVRKSGEEGTEIAEINKFNMYFLQEVKKQGTSVKSITNSDLEVEDNIPGDSIEFESGKKFSYNSSNNTIELLDQDKTIKLAKHIQSCTFTKKTSNDKTIVEVKITPQKLSMQTIKFVLNSESFIYENENNYIQFTTQN